MKQNYDRLKHAEEALLELAIENSSLDNFNSQYSRLVAELSDRPTAFGLKSDLVGNHFLPRSHFRQRPRNLSEMREEKYTRKRAMTMDGQTKDL